MRDLDLSSLRARLASAGRSEGRLYWRGLEELADTEEFREFLHREFPENASEFTDEIGRRRFLQLMGASLALAGVSACTRQPAERIVPYARQPEEIVPGRPLHFATAVTLAGVATGVLAESHMGRPTKIEGNPNHPASLGATDAIAQAEVLSLYDPDRSQTLKHLGEIRPWGAFLGAMRAALEAQREAGGAGLRLLTGTVTSPTLARQIRGLLAEFPSARWHQFEPAGRDAARAGARRAFGRPVEVRYDVARADVILSLDADLLASGPGAVRYAREFAARRRPDEGEGMNRLYVVESTPTPTGAAADHRLALAPSAIARFAGALAAGLGVPGAGGPAHRAGLPGGIPAWIAAVARDLLRHRGTGIVVAGEQQPPEIHALALAMNGLLGNLGTSVIVSEPIEPEPVDQMASFLRLVEEMRGGEVSLLVIAGGNPVYAAPADLDFAGALEKVALRVHLGSHEDETSELSHWHVPETHSLESWSDARAFDGTATILQPLIAPLYRGRSVHELLAALSSRPDMSGYELVRETWREAWDRGELEAAGAASFETFWRRCLHDGVVPGTSLPHRPYPLAPEAARGLAGEPAGPAGGAEGLEIAFRPDPHLFDGRHANNAWLQETPRPLTLLTWDNAALVSPATAVRLGLAPEQVVELEWRGRRVNAPVLVLPGQAGGCVTVHLGHGRRKAGRVGTGVGFDAGRLRESSSPWSGGGLTVRATGGRHRLATTQEHHSMEGRHLVRHGTLEDHRRDPAFARHMGHDPDPSLTLLPPHDYPGHAWGMSIDLNACIGCNACMVACQAENNVPVVGKDQVLMGREMHWLRVDRYWSGDPDAPEIWHQPVPCMHCENAPCEVVCPVGATVHSSEGLNDMVYNRCVGTRYCSNNCPYKVRRFNFMLYSDFTTPSLKMLRNPDVTVRSRGVMEKCTYCVQRINAARIAAGTEQRKIRDGEIVTACQAACPTEAIVFGDVNDPGSRVSRLKADPRDYTLLAELGARPRTSYQAALKNPNPELAAGVGTEEGGHA